MLAEGLKGDNTDGLHAVSGGQVSVNKLEVH